MDMRPMTQGERAEWPASAAPEGYTPHIATIDMVPKDVREPMYQLTAILELRVGSLPEHVLQISLILKGETWYGCNGRLYARRAPRGTELIGEWAREFPPGTSFEDAKEWCLQTLPIATIREAALSGFGFEWEGIYGEM